MKYVTSYLYLKVWYLFKINCIACQIIVIKQVWNFSNVEYYLYF